MNSVLYSLMWLCLIGSSIKCQEDYSVEDLIGLFIRGVGLTADYIFSDGYSYVPIDKDVRIFCVSRYKNF